MPARKGQKAGPAKTVSVVEADSVTSQAGKVQCLPAENACDRVAPSALGMLKRILKVGRAAEAVLLEALDSVGRVPPNTGFSAEAWLVLRARELALAQVQSVDGRSSRSSMLPRTFAEAAGWLPQTRQVLHLDSRRPLLQRVMNELPKGQRRALELVVFDGCTEADVAKTLRLPPARAAAELRAAMTFVRHRIHAVMGTWIANI